MSDIVTKPLPDCSSRSQGNTARVWYNADGAALRCSPLAYAMLKGMEDGLDDEALKTLASSIGGRQIDVSQIPAIKTALFQRAAQTTLRQSARRQGMTWHARILDGVGTTALTSPLQKLLGAQTVRRSLACGFLIYLTGFATIAARGLDAYTMTPTALEAVGGYLILLMILTLHEGGHAAALQRLGQRTNGMGLGIFIVFPTFYTDVTRAWSLPPKQRVLVDLAGLHFQFIATAPLFLAFALVPNGALLAGISLLLTSFLFAANPFLRNDGYWALSDWLDRPNLKSDCYGALGAILRARPVEWRLALYALADSLVMLTIVLLAAKHLWASLWLAAATPPTIASYALAAGSCALTGIVATRLWLRLSLLFRKGRT